MVVAAETGGAWVRFGVDGLTASPDVIAETIRKYWKPPEVRPATA